MADQIEHYIGIMSGTSMDAIDAVLVRFNTDNTLDTIHTHSQSFPDSLRQNLIELIQPSWTGSLSDIASLNAELGSIYGETVNQLLRDCDIAKDDITAIGNHGQTIWHQPEHEHAYSWQLGDANRISEASGITTVADFRNRDIAASGEGAPLVPAFHEAVFAHPKETRVIVNIGGIANISLLSPDKDVIGFDTGPGNGLMDAWCLKHLGKAYDENGKWAAQGSIIPELLTQMLADPYFARSFPKSTGKELFNLAWLAPFLSPEMAAEDVQATLLELTARSIVESVKAATDEITTMYVCGGGFKNKQLMARLQALLGDTKLDLTTSLGVDAEWVEAVAFAWLARQTILGLPGNLPSATGAKGFRVLGAIYPA
ncbi:anhydro-N-acetylmuramic acid kinase [Leucothrix arctica]|uniref:anhydro-N-acetylmuramic acid kinase n=1 Tax=Leucothrix arctica TaxID=1481894 RepID=UPI001FE4180D|nr:anhydro-N-acetylmuramic acid kinase [Leucothrix arctica]